MIQADTVKWAECQRLKLGWGQKGSVGYAEDYAMLCSVGKG